MKELAAAVEANEPGCISYGLFKDEKNARVIVFERYLPSNIAGRNKIKTNV
jgi:quinol monooxygenase YgiN